MRMPFASAPKEPPVPDAIQTTPQVPGIPSGMERMVGMLRALIPDNIWKAVETNLIALGGEVKGIKETLQNLFRRSDDIANELAEVRKQNTEILALLKKEAPDVASAPAVQSEQA